LRERRQVEGKACNGRPPSVITTSLESSASSLRKQAPDDGLTVVPGGGVVRVASIFHAPALGRRREWQTDRPALSGSPPPFGGNRTDDPTKPCADRIIERFEGLAFRYQPRCFLSASCFIAGVGRGRNIAVGVVWTCSCHRSPRCDAPFRRQSVNRTIGDAFPAFGKGHHCKIQKGLSGDVTWPVPGKIS
jgi:hypothetical protein